MTSRENKFQSKVKNYLTRKGCFVIITEPRPGVPTGTPDVIALLDGGGWVALEVKRESPYRKDGVAKKGAFRPLQRETIAKLDEMYYSRIVFPENWEQIKRELDELI